MSSFNLKKDKTRFQLYGYWAGVISIQFLNLSLENNKFEKTSNFITSQLPHVPSLDLNKSRHVMFHRDLGATVRLQLLFLIITICLIVSV